MFTIEDLQEVQSEKNNIFSPEKSRLSYEISLMTGTERGVCAERLLYRRFVKDGWNVKHVGGPNPHDMEIVQDGRTYKIEVKLATYGVITKTINKTYYGYQFRNVKPDLFDVIFFVFVTPDGVLVRWTASEEVQDWAYDKKEDLRGYTITANKDRKIRNLDDSLLNMDDFCI